MYLKGNMGLIQQLPNSSVSVANKESKPSTAKPSTAVQMWRLQHHSLSISKSHPRLCLELYILICCNPYFLIDGCFRHTFYQCVYQG